METKYTLYIIAVLFLIMGFVLIAFLVYPALKDIKSISREILSKRIEAASMDFQNKELDHFKREYKQFRPSLESISRSFIDVKNPVDFIKFLEKTAAGLAIDFDINLNASSKKEELASQPVVAFQISAKGEFVHILAFSEKLEKGPYLVNIKNVSIKKTEKDILDKTGPNAVDASFLIEVVSQ